MNAVGLPELIMTPYIQANTTGRLHAADEPSISPLNRGFLYGDAIYEVWRTYHGVIFAWEEHGRRLERSALALHMALPLNPEQMLNEIRKTVVAFRKQVPTAGELYIRVQVTRGTGQIGLDIALAEKTDFTILVQENKLFSEEKFAAGLKLSLAELRRNPPEALNPAWKTGNYLNNILCLREARMRGADEVVITNMSGEIAEAAVCNIGFVRDGRVITPPLSAGILAGITRDILIKTVAPAAGIPVSEEPIRPHDLPEMQECFLLSSTKDLTPVASIDGYQFSLGPNSVTMRLKRAFLEFAKTHAEAHPELKV
jgi:branched-chain amino acid aminotransferase